MTAASSWWWRRSFRPGRHSSPTSYCRVRRSSRRTARSSTSTAASSASGPRWHHPAIRAPTSRCCSACRGRLGADLGCPTPDDAMAECASVAPLFGGVSHHGWTGGGPSALAVRVAVSRGQGALYHDGFATPDGRVHLASRPYLPPGEQSDEAYPFVLVTGRRLEHYNSGSMTRRTGNLALAAGERLDLHPTDAARIGIPDGSRVGRAQPARPDRDRGPCERDGVARRTVRGVPLPGHTGERAHVRAGTTR